MVGENASPSATAGRIRCWHALQEHVEAPDQQGIEQQKAGDVRQRQPRRDLSGERQPLQQHAEHEQQDQSPEKFRNRQQHDRGEVRHRLEHRAAQAKQQQAAAETQHRRDRHGAGSKLDRRRQGGGDQRTGVAAQRDGAAEVAVQRVREPDQVLLRQGLIEAHLAAFVFDFRDRRVRRQRHRGGIDRQ